MICWICCGGGDVNIRFFLFPLTFLQDIYDNHKYLDAWYHTAVRLIHLLERLTYTRGGVKAQRATELRK